MPCPRAWPLPVSPDVGQGRNRQAYHPAVLILTHPIEILKTCDPIDEQNAVQMIQLVVDHYRIEALKDPVKGPSARPQTDDPHVVRSRGDPIETGEAQATVEIRQLVTGFHDARIDERKRRTGILVATWPSAKADHDNAMVGTDLGRRQPYPVAMGVQRVNQILHQ